MSAVVLFSGGIDSTTTAAVAARDGHETVHLLSLQYGSLHQESEMHAAGEVVTHLRIRLPSVQWKHNVLTLPDIFRGSGSALMGEAPMPDDEYSIEGPSPTVVPFRNANFISVATTEALNLGCESVYIGVHATDHRHWAYPDCSPEFIGAMANAVYVGTMHKVRLVAPLIWLTKAGVIELGWNLNAPLEYSWSCYEGGKIHCGKCPTCRERHRAFMTALGYDPTLYLQKSLSI